MELSVCLSVPWSLSVQGDFLNMCMHKYRASNFSLLFYGDFFKCVSRSAIQGINLQWPYFFKSWFLETTGWWWLYLFITMAAHTNHGYVCDWLVATVVAKRCSGFFSNTTRSDVDIVTCQRGEVSNEPTGLRAATRHGASDPLVR